MGAATSEEVSEAKPAREAAAVDRVETSGAYAEMRPQRRGGPRDIVGGMSLRQLAIGAVIAGAALVSAAPSYGAPVEDVAAAPIVMEAAAPVATKAVVEGQLKASPRVVPGSIEAIDLSGDDWRRERLRDSGTRFFNFQYSSGGDKIGAIIAVPKGFDGKEPAKVAVFNRGGNSDFGAMHESHLFSMHHYLVDQGYVVIAPEHRGTKGNQGADQFGGPKDIQSTLAAVDIARALPALQGDEVFMVGHSRGGITTYQALAQGANVKAAAVLAGVADLDTWAEERKTSLNEDLETDIFDRHIPGYEDASPADQAKLLSARSVVDWADDIDVPLVIVHGDEDVRVSHAQGAAAYDALKEADEDVELVTIAGGDHDFTMKKAKVGDVVDAFFDDVE